MKVDHPFPSTRIPELLGMPLTGNQYEVVAKVAAFCSRLEESELIPAHELSIRWRLELAATFLAALIDHARTAGQNQAVKDGLSKLGTEMRKNTLVDLALVLAIKRAREIDEQGHA
jgi:hypothetical protein